MSKRFQFGIIVLNTNARPCKQYVYFQPFRVRSDIIRKIYPNPDRHLFARSTLAEDVDIHFRIATLFNYNIVVSRACAATHKKWWDNIKMLCHAVMTNIECMYPPEILKNGRQYPGEMTYRFSLYS